MGLRQLVWAVIAALLMYGGWQLMRALRAARKTTTASPPPAARRNADVDAPAGDDRDDEDDDDAGFNYAPVPSASAAAQPAANPAQMPEERKDYFALELDVQRLRREVGALRAALDVQQDEIGALHAEVKRLGESKPAPVVANDHSPMRNISPEYGEALVLARRGLGVEDIAARCGITRAEAELVVSLAARGEAEGA